jgi:hypothetical protein
VAREGQDTDHGQCRKAACQQRLKVVSRIESTRIGARGRFDHRQVEGYTLSGTNSHAGDDSQTDDEIEQQVDESGEPA